MSQRISTRMLCPAALTLLLAGSARGIQDPKSDSWSWRVAPYLWATDIDGSASAGPIDAEFETEFSDIWDNLDGALLLSIESRKGQYSILGDFIYMGLEVDGETPMGADADMELDTTILQLAGLYRLAPDSPFELGLGLRYSDLQFELDAGAFSPDSDNQIFDGFAAGRASWPFAERFRFSLYGDVGAGDSDLTWQTAAIVGMQFDNWGIGFGYRALDYDFEDGSDEFDMRLEGLLFGLEFSL